MPCRETQLARAMEHLRPRNRRSWPAGDSDGVRADEHVYFDDCAQSVPTCPLQRHLAHIRTNMITAGVRDQRDGAALLHAYGP